MKCKICGGTGKVRGYFYEKTGVNKWEKVWGDSPCDECNGTGEVEQTEQEWLQTADTEQLAEFLSRVFQARAFCEICDIRKRCKISAGCKYGNKPYRECWKEWLKQPHTFK